MAKNIMRRFRMAEISAVDRPAQAGARALIMKRFDDDPIGDFAKVSFQEALDAATLEERFNRAFYDAFQNIYTLNEAFRNALKDRYQDSQESARAYVAAVAELAQRAIESTSGISKSQTPDPTIIKAVIEAAIKEAQGETDMTIATRTALVAAIEKFQKDGGTQADIDAIKTAATTLNAEDALPATGALAKTADTNDQLAALQARLDKADKIGALTADARKFYDGLPDDAARDAFLAKSADERTAQMTAGQGDDPVLHKCADGTEIRKSDGPAALALAKGFDAMMARVAKAEAIAGNADLRKRAETDLSKLAGTIDTHMAILKAIDGIPDEAVRTAALDSLRSANKAAGGAFVRVGTSAGGPVVKTDGPLVSDALTGPDAELDTMAKAAMPEHGNDYFKAYEAVIETPEGRQLYKQSVEQAAS